MTGCPGLSQTFDAYGTKVSIDPQICVSDSYCTKIKACPSFEMVKVFDYHPTKFQKRDIIKQKFVDLPLPVVSKDLEMIASGKDYRVVVIGVGGSGVTTISRVLAEAATLMGGRDDLTFKFVDQKGLAQRNGSVSSHLSIFHKNKSHGPIVPVGTADIVISPDLLEGSRAAEYLAKEGTLIIDSDYQVPLSLLLDKGTEGDVLTANDLQDELKSQLGNRLVMAPLKSLCFEKFQRPVYASAMILGVAFQAGKLPFSLSDLNLAFKNAIPKSEYDSNWEAFSMGRHWYLTSETKIDQNEKSYGFDIKAIKESLLFASYPWQRKDKLIGVWDSYLKLLSPHFPQLPENYLAHYLHDILVYDQGKNLAEFYHQAFKISSLYENEDKNLALRILVKTFWIKDEVFVSHLMSSPLKLMMDKLNYHQFGSRFEIVHINRPAFDFLGKKIEFDFSPKLWMLKIMRHFRGLRLLLPGWHLNEKKIAAAIRKELVQNRVGHKR